MTPNESGISTIRDRIEITGTIPMRSVDFPFGVCELGGGATKSAGPTSCVFFVTGFMMAIVYMRFTSHWSPRFTTSPEKTYEPRSTGAWDG